jgi:methanogenic corrinoid protein MtbC1
MASHADAEEIFEGLAQAVIAFDEDKSAELARAVLEKGIDPTDAILKGLSVGMEKAGKLYEQQEYFIPELLACADALNAAIELLKPHITVKSQGPRIKVVIGTIEGDVHEIGKNLVRIMYDAAGWEIYDLGVNVKTDRFLEEQRKTGADVVAISALMTTSMLAIPEVVKPIKAYDPRITVIVGGAPLTLETARKYGADGYSDSCGSAVKDTLDAMRRVRGEA